MNFIISQLLLLTLGFPNPEVPVFEQEVRLILKTHCFECHGEGEKLRGGLDLRLKKLIVAGGETGPGIVVNDPEKSLLIDKVTTQKMPPGKRKLQSQEIALLKTWISTGANTASIEPKEIPRGFIITENDKDHWAFKKIKDPTIPTVKSTSIVNNPIDAFVLHKLESKGLTLSKNAEKHLLLRRAFIDLIGMPPTPLELESFLNDSSPDAYEKQIGLLLKSAHYGERWGRHWLDMAGYADSEGFDGSDVIRTSAYHYRDYVIRSLNEGKPLNQFILEQLQGMSY